MFNTMMLLSLAAPAFAAVVLDGTDLTGRLNRAQYCTPDGQNAYGSGHFVQCCSGSKKCLTPGSPQWEWFCKSCGDSCPSDHGWSSRTCVGGGPSPSPQPNPSPPSPSPGGAVDATSLHWNAHRPCATSEPPCVALAQERLGAMAHEVGAMIVGAVELADSIKALPGWDNTGMQCDHSAVMVNSPAGWHIEKSGGGCMNGDDVKGFAVALVVPPQAVQGCSKLCVFMGHVPHGGVQSGAGEIENVCGSYYRSSCAIAMADWNSPTPQHRFEELFGDYPTFWEPKHDLTCCYHTFEFAFDHCVSNIKGAYDDGSKIFQPQLTRFSYDYDEHKPTSVKLRLPMA